jgi:hypothetical protein
MGTDLIHLVAAPEVCGYTDALLLTMGRPFGTRLETEEDAVQYVRDPAGELQDRTAVTYESSVALPADASFSRLRYDSMELWTSVDTLDEAVWIARDGVVERWPRVFELVACAA